MALTKYKLGELIELCDLRNTDEAYTLENVKGISIQKYFIDMIESIYNAENCEIKTRYKHA